jgi:hypothetical protein
MAASIAAVSTQQVIRRVVKWPRRQAGEQKVARVHVHSHLWDRQGLSRSAKRYPVWLSGATMTVTVALPYQEHHVVFSISIQSEASTHHVYWLKFVLIKVQGRVFLVSLFSGLTIRFQYYFYIVSCWLNMHGWGMCASFLQEINQSEESVACGVQLPHRTTSGCAPCSLLRTYTITL